MQQTTLRVGCSLEFEPTDLRNVCGFVVRVESMNGKGSEGLKPKQAHQICSEDRVRDMVPCSILLHSTKACSTFAGQGHQGAGSLARAAISGPA